ncbi:hypothetical protein ACMFL9_32245 (plasmid) [Sinorhizobium meliloti]
MRSDKILLQEGDPLLDLTLGIKVRCDAEFGSNFLRFSHPRLPERVVGDRSNALAGLTVASDVTIVAQKSRQPTLQL